jgi:hypothetical protein
MAITLQTIPAPGATPIANTTTSETAFWNNYFKLAPPNISTQDVKGILIDALIYSLAAAGGANYKLKHKNLIQDAFVYTNGLKVTPDPWVAFACTAVSAAKTADGTFSLDVPTLLNEARDLVQLSETSQDNVITLLLAQLQI